MRVIIDIQGSYEHAPLDFTPMPATIEALRMYDRRGGNIKDLESIKDEHWYSSWFERTTDHVVSKGYAVGITKHKYLVVVLDIDSLDDLVALSVDSNFEISFTIGDYVEIPIILTLK